jgi:hypothetical protein
VPGRHLVDVVDERSGVAERPALAEVVGDSGAEDGVKVALTGTYPVVYGMPYGKPDSMTSAVKPSSSTRNLASPWRSW